MIIIFILIISVQLFLLLFKTENILRLIFFFFSFSLLFLSLSLSLLLLKKGFDCRVSSLDGKYGSGIYFTDDIEKSDKYCDDDREGLRHVIFSRVVVGSPCLTNRYLRNQVLFFFFCFFVFLFFCFFVFLFFVFCFLFFFSLLISFFLFLFLFLFSLFLFLTFFLSLSEKTTKIRRPFIRFGNCRCR